MSTSAEIAFHVVPRPDRGWSVRRADRGIVADFAGKAEAIAGAQRLARAQPRARVVVHGRDFAIESEWAWRGSATTRRDVTICRGR